MAAESLFWNKIFLKEADFVFITELKKRKVFTPWSEYEDDEPLGNENNE